MVSTGFKLPRFDDCWIAINVIVKIFFFSLLEFESLAVWNDLDEIKQLSNKDQVGFKRRVFCCQCHVDDCWMAMNASAKYLLNSRIDPLFCQVNESNTQWLSGSSSPGRLTGKKAPGTAVRCPDGRHPNPRYLASFFFFFTFPDFAFVVSVFISSFFLFFLNFFFFHFFYFFILLLFCFVIYRRCCWLLLGYTLSRSIPSAGGENHNRFIQPTYLNDCFNVVYLFAFTVYAVEIFLSSS